MERDIETGRRGFTLLELVIVIMIIAILVAISIPIYQAIIVRTRETALLDDLRIMRNVIDQYTADKKKAPLALQDLVDAGYFREIPKDPITGSRDTWQVQIGTSMMSPDQTEVGIEDVHSGSSALSSEGLPYSSY